MAFGIICDRCGEICHGEDGDTKAYEIQIDAIKGVDSSRKRIQRDIHLCCDCRQDLNKFLNNKKV